MSSHRFVTACLMHHSSCLYALLLLRCRPHLASDAGRTLHQRVLHRFLWESRQHEVIQE